MLKKIKYKWKNHQKRSVFEIVSEDGTMKIKEIYHIVEQLCSLSQIKDIEDLSKISNILHPQNVIVHMDNTVQTADESVPLSLREMYIPPESDMSSGSVVYALGMLMLFMATGNTKKSDLDTFVDDGSFKSLVERCIAFDPDKRYKSSDELLKDIRRAGGNNKKSFRYFLLGLILLFSTGVVLWFYHSGRSLGETTGKASGFTRGYAAGYEKGFADAPGIGIGGASFDKNNGNLLGNMVSEEGAMAAFNEDTVFFIHENNIYKMNPYTEEIQVLINNVKAFCLNYYEGWLYYSTDERILRFSLQSMKEEVYLDAKGGLLYIVDGEFYLNDINNTGYLYKINKESRELTQLNGMTEYISLHIVNDKLYYIDPHKNNSIYKADFDGGNIQLINSNSFESFSIHNNKIYAYATSFKDNTIDYSMSFLMSMDLDGGNIESFTNIPAYNIIVTDGGIYYISGNKRTLNWMSLGGRVQYTISSIQTEVFNIAKGWIFYLNAEDESWWRVSIDGFKNKKISFE